MVVMVTTQHGGPLPEIWVDVVFVERWNSSGCCCK